MKYGEDVAQEALYWVLHAEKGGRPPPYDLVAYACTAARSVLGRQRARADCARKRGYEEQLTADGQLPDIEGEIDVVRQAMAREQLARLDDRLIARATGQPCSLSRKRASQLRKVAANDYESP
jgi:hypothetical protein